MPTRFLFRLGLTVFILWPTLGEGRMPLRMKGQQLIFWNQTEYFLTTANYTNNFGEFESLPGQQKYQNILSRFGGLYSASPNWAIEASAGLAHAISDGSDFQRTNSEITELTLGVQYNWVTPWIKIRPEAYGFYPLNRVDVNTDDVLTGEGAMGLQAGTWFYERFFDVNAYTYLGTRLRDEDRSHLFLYEVGLLKHWSKTWATGGVLKGYNSITDDKFTNTPDERHSLLDRVNGGSQRYYSVNPSLFEGRGWIGYYPSRTFGVRLGYGRTFNGQNAAAGNLFFATVIWNMGVGANPLIRESQQRSKDFEIESEDYERELFE